MEINLPILPLEIIDNLSYQKCLIPKQKFPRVARPGQWAKCYFIEPLMEEQYFAIAQIYPRYDLDEVCYLDISVTNYNRENIQLILKELMILEHNKDVAQANVTFQLDPAYFIDNFSVLNELYFHDVCKTMLQKYHLNHNSFIRDKYLLNRGIESTYIEIDHNAHDCGHIITDFTCVKIKDISLTCKLLNSNPVFLNVKPFDKTRQELEDLLKLSILKRHQNRSLSISLNTVLVGAIGCGKTSLVKEFLQTHQCNLFNIEISHYLKQYPGETEAELRKIFKAAQHFEKRFQSNYPTVILVEDLHLLCPQNKSTNGSNSETLANYMRICNQFLSLIDELFQYGTNIICLATTSKPDNLNELVRRAGRFENQVSITALQEDDRSNILEKLLKASLPNFYVKPKILKMMSKQTQGNVLADLALLVRNVTQIILTKPEDDIEKLIAGVLQKSKPISSKQTDVVVYKTTETFDSIGGMQKLKKKLEISFLAGLKHPKSFKRFHLSLPKGVLLYGPPGCAKTTIVKCLATEANMTFIATSGAEVYSPYIGCAEKFIAKIFETARKNSPCLIFLDEIDSLVGRRSLDSHSNSGDVQTRILSTLLTEMDGIITTNGQSSNIVVVAATNRPDMVDDALMRPGRFDKLIHVSAPDFPSRQAIFNLYKEKMPFSKSLDLNYLAVRTEKYSGADICNICNEASLEAFQRDFNCNEIIIEDFESVLRKTKSSLLQSQIDLYYEFENKVS